MIQKYKEDFGFVMKKEAKKDVRYLNVCMSRELHDKFEKFCKAYGMSKVGATEQAIKLYMDKVTMKS